MSTNYTFDSLILCQNLTYYCFGHGECQETVDNDFSCECNDFYDTLTSCEICYFQIYKGADAFYYVVGWICCILGLGVLIPEIIFDIYNKRYNNPNFYAKCMSFGYCISRMIDLGFWSYYSITQQVIYEKIDFFIHFLANISALSCYMLIILMWIGLYTRIATLSKRESRYFIISKMVLIIGNIIYIIVAITLSIIYSLGISPTIMNTIYNLVGAVYLVSLMIWSWYHAFKMAKYFNYQIQTNSAVSFLKKNTLLSIANVVFGSYVITLGLIEVASSAWGYLIVYFILRFEEYIILYLGIAILQNYFCVGGEIRTPRTLVESVHGDNDSPRYNKYDKSVENQGVIVQK